MPAMIAARLYRALPLLVILAIIAVVVYVFMSWRYTTARAKEALIKVSLAGNTALTVLFALATLYAFVENNTFAADFFITCGVCTLAVLGITLLCRWRFLKNNPDYRWRLTAHAKKKRK